MKENIGSKIRRLRKENGDTLKSLALKLEMDYSNLSKVERGDRGASIELLNSLIELYRVNPNYFLGSGYSEEEGQLVFEEDLSPSSLKEKYEFIIDGVKATDKEIEEAIRLIRYLHKEDKET